MISEKSEVDETLFGQPTKSTRGRPRSGEAAGYVSKEMMAGLNDCTVIGSAELERLKVLPHTLSILVLVRMLISVLAGSVDCQNTRNGGSPRSSSKG